MIADVAVADLAHCRVARPVVRSIAWSRRDPVGVDEGGEGGARGGDLEADIDPALDAQAADGASWPPLGLSWECH